MKKKLLIGLLLSVLLIAAVFITAVFAKTDIGGAIMAILLVVGVILLITTVKSVVSRVLRKIDYGSVEIYHRGRLNRPLFTFQQAARKGSRAAVRRSSCP